MVYDSPLSPSGLGKSIKVEVGGTYTFVLNEEQEKLQGLVRFPLQQIMNNKIVGGNKRHSSPQWYCPFTAGSVEDSGKLLGLSLKREDLYFLGTELPLRACFRSAIPQHLTSDRFFAGYFKKRDGTPNERIYRIPAPAFDSTFFSGRGQYLAPSLDLFIEEVTKEASGFEECTIRQKKDFIKEMKYQFGVGLSDEEKKSDKEIIKINRGFKGRMFKKI